MDSLFYAGDRALFLVVALSAVPIAVATVIGLLVALIQAVTHLQEQTLPFGVKLLAVCLSLYWMGEWLGSRVEAYGHEMLRLAFQ